MLTEPLIPRVAREDMPERWRLAAERNDIVRGEATVVEVLAHAPELLAWYYDGFYGKVFFEGRVPRRDKELVRLRLSGIHGCAFCNKGNRVSAREAGLSDEQIALIGEAAAPCFDAKDRALMALADQISLPNMQGALTPALHAALAAHYDPAQIVELGLVAAVLTGMAKFLFVYDLVSRETNCPIG